MKLDSFKLRLATLASGIDSRMTVVDTYIEDHNDIYGAYYHRINLDFKGLPLFFTLITHANYKELDLEDLKETILLESYEFENLLDKPLSKKHITYFENHCCEIFGREYEDIECLNPRGSWRLIRERLEDIKSEVGDNFNDIYLTFINTTSAEDLNASDDICEESY